MIASVGSIGLREHAHQASAGTQAHGAVRSLDLLPFSRILASFPPRHAQALARQFSRIRQQATALDAATERQLQCLLAAQQEQQLRWQAHALQQQQQQQSDEAQQVPAAADTTRQTDAAQPSGSATAALLSASPAAGPLSPLPSQTQVQCIMPTSSGGSQPLTAASGMATAALLPVGFVAMCCSYACVTVRVVTGG